MPAPQSWQVLLLGMASPVEYAPAWQFRQMAELVADRDVENFPAEHEKQYWPVDSAPYKYNSSNSRFVTLPASLLTANPM